MKPTVHFDDTPEDPDQFAGRVQRSANALAALGICQGSVVALMLHNEPALLELMLAARSLGAHYCLINWHFKAAEVRHVLSDSNARVLVIHENLAARVSEGIPDGVKAFVARPRLRTLDAFARADAASVASVQLPEWEVQRDGKFRPAATSGRPGSLMVYTSGTTGLPKGVRRESPTPEQLGKMAQVAKLVLGIEPGMRALVSAPLYHSAPASYVMQALLKDAELWVEPRFDAEHTLRLIATHRLTHAYLVPTMFRRLLRLPPEVRARYDTSSMRFVACTGAPFPPQVKREMIDWWGPVIHEAYAASELGWITHIDSFDAIRKPGSVGRAVPGTVLKVLSDTGEELPIGSVGLIHARQEAVPDFTYSNNDRARRELERDGLWTLRDVGFLDDEGFLYVVDRQSDMVISGGVNIYPAEIEAVLATFTGVADCAVFGVPDEEFGEALLAAVQPQPGVDLVPAEMQAYLRERLAGYKVPRTIVFHDQMPREDTGKIFKRKLREPYWAGQVRRI